jgi:hypothetical protein
MQGTETRPSKVDVTVVALDVSDIQSIELASGWRNVRRPELVQAAIGKAHSPITPNRLYPSLQYETENGQPVITPLSQVLSFSAAKAGKF